MLTDARPHPSHSRGFRSGTSRATTSPTILKRKTKLTPRRTWQASARRCETTETDERPHLCLYAEYTFHADSQASGASAPRGHAGINTFGERSIGRPVDAAGCARDAVLRVIPLVRGPT